MISAAQPLVAVGWPGAFSAARKRMESFRGFRRGGEFRAIALSLVRAALTRGLPGSPTFE